MTTSLQDRIAAILTGYGWPGLRGDVRGGVATAVVVLPEALALGVAVAATSGDDPGVGALAGLWGRGRGRILRRRVRREPWPDLGSISADDGGDDRDRQSVQPGPRPSRSWSWPA